MKAKIQVTQIIEVEIDEKKFDKKFLEDFRSVFYDFEDIGEHLKHLGQLFARGLIGYNSFIEGYGEPEEMGISFKDINDTDIEIIK